MAPVTRPRARGRGRAPGANPMPGGAGRNKGIDPGFSGPGRKAFGNGGTQAPATGRGRRSTGGAKPGSAIGEGSLVGPGGRQLQAKVQAGTLTSEQAKRTLSQRQTLAKALGPNWRDKLTVGGESFAQVNKQLKANPGNAKLAAIRKKLVTNRSSVLAAARAKNKGGAGSQEEED